MPLSNRYRRLSVAPMAHLERRGRGSLGGGGSAGRIRIPFRRAPTLSREPIPFSAYCPNSIYSRREP